MLVDVVEETGESTQADPLILEHAPVLFGDLLHRLLDEKSDLRIDLPRDMPGSRGPLVCGTASDVDRFVANMANRFVGRNAHECYPASVWRVPRECRAEGFDAIESFRNAPGDEDAFGRVMELGIWRAALFPSSVTLSVPCGSLDDAVALVRGLLADSPLEVDWA